MSVPETKRGEGKLEVLVKARELATYTVKITGNTNVFKADYYVLTNKIVGYALDIYTKCWTANNIRVDKDPEKAKRRLSLQESAAMDCNNLLSLMQIAWGVFHLKAKRIEYWGNLILETRKLIRSWCESDYKRYGHLE